VRRVTVAMSRRPPASTRAHCQAIIIFTSLRERNSGSVSKSSDSPASESDPIDTDGWLYSVRACAAEGNHRPALSIIISYIGIVSCYKW
jgi:hypothetical protein